MHWRKLYCVEPKVVEFYFITAETGKKDFLLKEAFGQLTADITSLCSHPTRSKTAHSPVISMELLLRDGEFRWRESAHGEKGDENCGIFAPTDASAQPGCRGGWGWPLETYRIFPKVCFRLAKEWVPDTDNIIFMGEFLRFWVRAKARGWKKRKDSRCTGICWSTTWPSIAGNKREGLSLLLCTKSGTRVTSKAMASLAWTFDILTADHGCWQWYVNQIADRQRQEVQPAEGHGGHHVITICDRQVCGPMWSTSLGSLQNK